MIYTIPQLKEKLTPIFLANDVSRSSVFGSTARGEDKPDGDIDILVEFKKSKGLFEFVRLKRELEKILSREVDLLTYKSIHPRLKDYIERDAIQFYG